MLGINRGEWFKKLNKTWQDYFLKLNIPVADADFQQSELQQWGLFGVAMSCLRVLQYYLIPFCGKEYVDLLYTKNIHHKILYYGTQ